MAREIVSAQFGLYGYPQTPPGNAKTTFVTATSAAILEYPKPFGSPCGSGPTNCSGQALCDGFGRCQPNDYPDGTRCGEGDSACSFYECHRGVCGTELVYRTCEDDGIACTVDPCDPDTGKCNTPDDAYCDDQVQCTTDSCNPDTEGDGCEHIPNHAACDDNNSCTVDSCTSNGCENLYGGNCDDAGFGSRE